MHRAILLIFLIAWVVAQNSPVKADTPPLPLLDLSDLTVAALPARDMHLDIRRDASAPLLTVDAGHSVQWPGFTLVASPAAWDLRAFDRVELTVRNIGTAPVTVGCRVDNAGADGTHGSLATTADLIAGERKTITVRLQHPGNGPALNLFAMRGLPPGVRSAETSFDPAAIHQIIFFIAEPTEDHQLEIASIQATGTYVAPTTAPIDPAKFFPFIDAYGQYIHADWPNKTHTDADLHHQEQAETQDLAAHPGPSDWDRFGGWQSGPTLEAKGHFYPTKQDGKWWLVDPDGHLFFSNGINCVTPWEGLTPIDDRPSWFADLPNPATAPPGLYRPGGISLTTHYRGRSPMCFDFGISNLIRKYGHSAYPRQTALAHQRLRSWGLNTLGNWSDPNTCHQQKTPYVVTILFQCPPLAASKGYWAPFHDVFAPQFAPAVAAACKKAIATEDPWCIGYFLDNELAWGDETSLALSTIQSPATQPAKHAFLADLQQKYPTIEALNTSWGTAHASWEALAASTLPPDKHRAAADLKSFSTKIADTYFRTCRDALKSAAPNALYLGCRFAGVNPIAAAAAVKYCDVVSYNLYIPTLDHFTPPADVPIISTEFHFGALDRGLFHAGLVPVANQSARAAAYATYVQSALRHPNVVGTHWFKYQDEPTPGRPLDGENFQIGFLDIADTPYPETIQSARAVNYHLYETRSAPP